MTTAPTPIWLRAVVTREGPDVVTRCCVVAAGQVLPIEVRVNVPKLAATLRTMGLVPPGQDGVAGLGSFLKKAVRTVTKSKVVRAVGKAVKKVANSPVAMIANPAAIITAHTVSKAATGKGLVKGAAGKAIDLGTAVTMAAAGPAAKPPSALSFVKPQTAAALGVGLRAVTAAKTGGAIAAVAQSMQRQVNLGRVAAQAMKAGKVPAAKGQPFVQRARLVQSTVKRVAPALAKRAVLSAKLKASFGQIAERAKAGNPDAQHAATVLQKSAEALERIARLQASAAGGVPGLLVTADGRIVRAPRGRFQLRSTTALRPDILYRGPKEPRLKGVFSAVSGSPGWGGDDDPGNDLDGPFIDVTPAEDEWKLEDWSRTAGVLTP